MSGIGTINNTSPDVLSFQTNAFGEGEGGENTVEGGVQTGETTSIRQIATEVAPLLRDALKVLTGDDQEGMSIRDLIPEIDDAELADLAADMAELEELIALLTLENEEEQAKAIQARIEAKLKEMSTHHEKVLAKIQETIDKAVEQAKAQERNGVLGWILMALSVVAAVVSVALTAGAAAPGAFAIIGCVVGCVSASLTVVTTALEKSGKLKECLEADARDLAEKEGITYKKALEKVNKKYQLAMLITQSVLGLAALACSIGSLVTAAKAGGDAVEKGVEIAADIAKNSAPKWLQWAQLGMSILGVGGGITTTALAFIDLFKEKALAESEAELAELQKYLEKRKEAIAMEQEALEELLQKIQNSLSALAEILLEPLQSVENILNGMESQA